jgi:hypothetical protein
VTIPVVGLVLVDVIESVEIVVIVTWVHITAEEMSGVTQGEIFATSNHSLVDGVGTVKIRSAIATIQAQAVATILLVAVWRKSGLIAGVAQMLEVALPLA